MSEIKEVSVHFQSKIYFEQALPENAFSVPVALTRYGLSEIVNNLTGLEENKCPRPFDFVINGQLLRGDLCRYLKENRKSGEGGLKLEVVEAVKKPQSGTAHPHPDWISSVSTGPANENSAFVATGCYDGKVRVWATNSDQNDPVLGEGHQSAVKSVDFFNKPSDNSWTFISGSKDKTARLWKYNEHKCQCISIFSGHTDSIEAVATQKGTKSVQRFVTGSWDKRLLIWKVKTMDDNNDDGTQSKKRRIEAIKKHEPTQVSEPIGDLVGHRSAVTCCIWPVPIAIYTGSYDHTIRLWAPREGTCTRTFHGNAVVTSLDFSLRANLLISGHHDRVVRIWDPRMEGSSIVKLELKSHSGWVTGVKWSTIEPHLCASVSHDSTVKIWDIRTSIPLHTLTSHTDKVLCIDFDHQRQVLVTGGCDGQMRTHKFLT